MADIRIREMSKEYMQKLDAIKKFIKLPIDPRSKGVNKTPEIILAMIDRFMNDQKSIASLRSECSRLHSELIKWSNKDNNRKELLSHALKNFKAYTRETEKLLKQFGQKKGVIKLP